MAEQLVFLAHYGKVTLREKFPKKGCRIMPDLPEAVPHLSLGYSVASPIFVTDAAQGGARGGPVRQPAVADGQSPSSSSATSPGCSPSIRRLLWRQTVYPGRATATAGSSARPPPTGV